MLNLEQVTSRGISSVKFSVVALISSQPSLPLVGSMVGGVVSVVPLHN